MVAERVRQVVELFKKTQAFVLRDMWAYDAAGGHRRIVSWALHILKVSFLVWKNLREKRFFLRAHALTYWTLISIVPVLAVMMIVLRGLGLSEDADKTFWPRIEKMVSRVAPVALDKAGKSDGAPGEDKPAKGQTDEGQAQEDAPETAQAAEQEAAVLVAKIKEYVANMNTRAIGAAGMTVAILTVISLLTKIEQGFNDIWDIRRKRTFANRVVVYWGVVTLPALMLVVASGMNIITISEKFLKRIEGVPVVGALAGGFIPYLFVWLAFTLLYKIMPNARVKTRSAILAGVLAGTLWQVANQGYSMYLAWTSNRLAVYRVVYGSLAAIPLFLMWVYLSWAIVLFGAGVAYADQNLSVFEREGVSLGTSFAARQFVGIRACVAIGQAYHYRVPPPSARDIAASLHVPVRIVNDCMKDLKALGYLAEMLGEDEDEEVTYQPATSLENCRLIDLVEGLRTQGGSDFPIPQDAAKAFLDDVRQRVELATRRELADLTLRDVVLKAGPLVVPDEAQLRQTIADEAGANDHTQGNDPDAQDKAVG